MADSTIHPITDWMTGVLATCESVRLELDDPLERLLDAVASDDQYEVVPLIRECVDALMGQWQLEMVLSILQGQSIFQEEIYRTS